MTTKSNINKAAVTRRYSKWHTDVLVYLDNADMPTKSDVFNQAELDDLMRDGFVVEYTPGPGWGSVLSVETDKILAAGFYTKKYAEELKEWNDKRQAFFEQKERNYQEWLSTLEGKAYQAMIANRN